MFLADQCTVVDRRSTDGSEHDVRPTETRLARSTWVPESLGASHRIRYRELSLNDDRRETGIARKAKPADKGQVCLGHSWRGGDDVEGAINARTASAVQGLIEQRTQSRLCCSERWRGSHGRCRRSSSLDGRYA